MNEAIVEDFWREEWKRDYCTQGLQLIMNRQHMSVDRIDEILNVEMRREMSDANPQCMNMQQKCRIIHIYFVARRERERIGEESLVLLSS